MGKDYTPPCTMGQIAPSAILAAEPSERCRGFVEDYVDALRATYRANVKLDEEALAQENPKERERLVRNTNTEWILFAKVLAAVRVELQDTECGTGIRNAFERLFLDTITTMRGRLHPPTMRLPPRNDGVFLYGPPATLAGPAAALLRAAYHATPRAYNMGPGTLEYLAALMQGQLAKMYTDAGRPYDEGARYILQDVPDDKVDGGVRVTAWPDDMEMNHKDTDLFFRLHKETDPPRPAALPLRCGTFEATLGELRAQSADTHRYVALVPGEVPFPFDDYTLTGVVGPEGRAGARPTFATLVGATKRDATKRRCAERVIVAGPVYVVFDAGMEPQARKGRPLLCVAAAAPNLAEDSPDRRAFVVADPDARACQLVAPPRVDPLRQRIRTLWHHVLEVFRIRRVEYIVLNAIGCGVFKGSRDKEVRDLPRLYAAELHSLLATGRFSFHGVAVALPQFTDSDARNFQHFREVFEYGSAALPMPVLLSPVHSMIDLADRIARDHPDAHVGMLNPADYMTVLGGFVGMFCEGSRGTIALEEFAAIQTTMRLGHSGVNPEPWTRGGDPARCIVHTLPVL